MPVKKKPNNICWDPKCLCPIFLPIIPLSWRNSCCPYPFPGSHAYSITSFQSGSTAWPSTPPNTPAQDFWLLPLYLLFHTFASFLRPPTLPFLILSKQMTLSHKEIWQHQDQCDWYMLRNDTMCVFKKGNSTCFVGKGLWKQNQLGDSQ
jgi:hypothetical protein